MAKASSTPAALDDERAIERFLIGEVRLLDERRFEDWRELFAEDGRYWVPLKPDQKSPDGESSLFFDDRKIMKYMYPEFLIRLDEMPMTPTGKIRKASLQEDAAKRAKELAR